MGVLVRLSMTEYGVIMDKPRRALVRAAAFTVQIYESGWYYANEKLQPDDAHRLL